MNILNYKTPKKTKELFQGKTIKKLELNACNCWIFHFTDETKVEVFSEVNGGLPFLEIYQEENV